MADAVIKTQIRYYDETDDIISAIRETFEGEYSNVSTTEAATLNKNSVDGWFSISSIGQGNEGFLMIRHISGGDITIRRDTGAVQTNIAIIGTDKQLLMGPLYGTVEGQVVSGDGSLEYIRIDA